MPDPDSVRKIRAVLKEALPLVLDVLWRMGA